MTSFDDAVTPGANDQNQRVAANITALRRQHGLTEEGVAKLSGIPRGTIENIEARREAPSLSVLWALAKVFEVPFSTLLGTERTGSTIVIRRETCPVIPSRGGGMSSRALFASAGERAFDAYALHLQPGSQEHSEPHARGTMEHIAVLQGIVEITTEDGFFRLQPGDVIVFAADVPHGYANPGDGEAHLLLVMSYMDL